MKEKQTGPRVEIVKMRLDALKPAPYNPRTISERAMKGLTASIDRFGLVQPIIHNKRTGHVVGGHQRLEVLKKTGAKTTDVIVVDLPLVEEKALNVMLNNPEIEGQFTGGLFTVLEEIQKELPDLYERMQLDDLRIEAIIDDGPQDGKTDPDDIPEPPARATTKWGDRIQLGDHVLLCGDSSRPEHLDRLLDGAKIHLVNTDPPYNVRVEPRSNNAIAAGNSSFENHHQRFDKARSPSVKISTHKQLRPKDRPLLNDFVTEVAFNTMLAAWFGNISRVLIPGRSFYIWGGTPTARITRKP